MNYDLTKELKDAGFPQYGDEPRSGSRAYTRDAEIIEYDDGFWRNGEPQYSVPTLEELIEACGERLHAFSLEMPFLRPLSIKTTWAARGKSEVAKKEWREWTGRGDTPTEAVARLWLALNKKEA